MGQWILGYSIFKQTHVCTMYILTYTQTCTDPHTLWEFVICVGTLESWACRRLEYPKSPGGLLQQNWSNWSNWRIDAAKLIKLEQFGQQFKPKCRYVCTTSWIWIFTLDGSLLARAIHEPTSPLRMSKWPIEQLTVCYNGFHTHTYLYIDIYIYMYIYLHM